MGIQKQHKFFVLNTECVITSDQDPKRIDQAIAYYRRILESVIKGYGNKVLKRKLTAEALQRHRLLMAILAGVQIADISLTLPANNDRLNAQIKESDQAGKIIRNLLAELDDSSNQ